ncbi:MAG: hypothetical protein ACOZNI_00160 [Myxococcota bacterium]
MAREVASELDGDVRWRIQPGLVAAAEAGLLRVLLTRILLAAVRAGCGRVVVGGFGEESFFVWGDRHLAVDGPTCARIAARLGGTFGGDGTEVVRFTVRSEAPRVH